ncbi:MAG: adenylyltransferase/cytidyltransferase family protein [Victivallales bacterium]|nr:adenylyltransferase/cytidyltransferase family protein [Victivallales bacterium]
MTHRAVATKIKFRNSELSPEEKKSAILGFLAERNPYNLELGGKLTDRIFGAYMQPHRYFHTLDHLLDICQAIHERHWEDVDLSSELLLTALFHDIVWYPQGNDSERRSVEAFDFLMGECGNPVPSDVASRVREAIIATSTQEDVSRLASNFNDLDCAVIIHGSPVDLLAYEFQIFREFQYLNMTDYRKGRSAFFKRFARRYPDCKENMKFLVEYLERRRPRVGIYAGTFNPFHIGHFSILQKAEMMFDKVIVAVGINPEKHSARKDSRLKELLPFHEVVYFDTLMVDLLDKESELSEVTLVRGLRNGYDLDYEMNQLCFMQEMRPDTHAVYIPCDKNLEHISSTALKGMSSFDVRGRDSIYYPDKYSYYRQSIEEMFSLK